MKRPAILLLFVVSLLSCGCGQTHLDRQTRQLLGELDGHVAAREVYVARKLDQMDALRKLAEATLDPQLRYETEMNIASEYFSFQFDSTQHYLKHCQELAMWPLRDRERFVLASIRLGHLYAKAGSHMEAYRLLYDQIDTTGLPETLKTEYLLAL